MRGMCFGGGIVIFVSVWLSGGWCADPVFTPEVVTDAGGNTANSSSFITWAPIPTYDPYSTGNIQYDASGLTPLYNFAKAFINGAVFPYGIPWGMSSVVCVYFFLDIIEINATIFPQTHTCAYIWPNWLNCLMNVYVGVCQMVLFSSSNLANSNVLQM
jgi:hypothetical protein